ncbi:hypothetical protein RHMOL_Rhmol13G0137700 [Rhododendron molle]|uniref:Uncharacterized protein n=1 Tax=Rhododendron molle TaxID=49168 RepID=A0ACC0L6D6_RHOML|nr:hypothetical protein RHMOL_Rhmol13G0137700 [Rhododendron molle]
MLSFGSSYLLLFVILHVLNLRSVIMHILNLPRSFYYSWNRSDWAETIGFCPVRRLPKFCCMCVVAVLLLLLFCFCFTASLLLFYCCFCYDSFSLRDDQASVLDDDKNYKRKRNEKIKRNNEICESHGVKSIATPFVGSVQQRKRVTAENGKRTRVELEDDGYRLSRDEDDPGHDSESVDSFEQALEMPRGCQRAPQSHPEPQSCATMISERVTRSTPQPNMDTQALPPPIVQPQSEALANNNVVLTVRRTRGPTRGKLAQRVIDKDGRLKVPIPPQFCAAVGEHASKLASKIGYEVRTHVMDLGVRRWKALDDSVKGPILQRLTDKFELQGDPIDVDKAVATQCGRRISNYTYKLKKKYDKLVKAKGAEYARSNPPGGVKPEQWTSLIDKKWNDKKWQKQSKANTNNRSDKKSKHICGSKSLPVRVVEMMEGTDGAVPALGKIYKSTHFNADTNEWIAPECEDIHDEIIRIEAEHNSQDGAVPITQGELSVKVFKAKSGYFKGLGMRPSSTVRSTIVESVNNNEYVTHLEKKVDEQDELIQEQGEKIQVQAEGIEAANATITELVEAKEQQGRALASVLEYLKNQGYTGYWCVSLSLSLSPTSGMSLVGTTSKR